MLRGTPVENHYSRGILRTLRPSEIISVLKEVNDVVWKSIGIGGETGNRVCMVNSGIQIYSTQFNKRALILSNFHFLREGIRVIDTTQIRTWAKNQK